MTFAEKVIAFYSNLEYKGELPQDVQVMNPFRNNPAVSGIIERFYNRFYNDNRDRYMILGINPGRFGAGATGIPFTDTIRLTGKCGIPFSGFRTYEPSSVYMYQMMEQFGGVNRFYGKFFVSAICPLGFTIQSSRGKQINYNYYDSPELTAMANDFIVTTLKQQIDFGIHREVCFCLGSGKNARFLNNLNARYGYFKSIVILEHPRYIMQYKSGFRDDYIKKYIELFSKYTSVEEK